MRAVVVPGSARHTPSAPSRSDEASVVGVSEEAYETLKRIGTPAAAIEERR